MTKRAARSSRLPLVVAAIAVILFSTAGIARMMGWGPDSTGNSGGILALDRADSVAASAVLAGPRCPECGMIVSTRELDAHEEDVDPGVSGGALVRYQDVVRPKAARRYEMTVRMADGTSRVINHTGPAGWRAGERLIVIDGTGLSGR